VKALKRLFWPVVLAGLVVVVVTDVRPAYVFAPLLGYGILRLGLAMFGSLQAGASYIPDGPAQPVDTATERTTYWCDGCGAEVLLLMRGAPVPPRHCGERMHERTEVARGRLN
jgi:hypothetical protein